MTLKVLVGKIITLFVNPFIIFLSALATLYFFWGLFTFMRKASSEDARAIGRRHMINAFWGLFLMISAYGFMNLLVGTFGFKKPPKNINVTNPQSSNQNEGVPYDFKKN